MTTLTRKSIGSRRGPGTRTGCIIEMLAVLALAQPLFAQPVGSISTPAITGEEAVASASEPAPPRPAAFRVFLQEKFADEGWLDRGWQCDAGVRPGDAIPELELDDEAVCMGSIEGQPLGTVELRSPAIDLAGLPGVELTYTFQHRGVEIGEECRIEFLNARGSWTPLITIRSDGRDSAYFTRNTVLLPVEALHTGFQFRFLADANDPDDLWCLGQAAVREYEPLHTLTVLFDPERPADVDVVLAGRPDGMEIAAPFARRFPSGARVFLIAPPAVGDNLFSHWTVGGRTETRRVLAIEMAEDLEVQAHYGVWTPQRAGVAVALLARPLSDVRVKLGYEPGQWLIEVATDTEIPALTGEWILLLAPERTKRLAFERWNVNGERQRTGETLLEHQIQGTDVLAAEYALLGDMNGDDVLDKFDVDIFIAALIDPGGYARMYPNLNREQRCDINGDGLCDTLDLEAFVDLLTAE